MLTICGMFFLSHRHESLSLEERGERMEGVHMMLEGNKKIIHT